MCSPYFSNRRPAGVHESSIAAEAALSFGRAPADARPNVFSVSSGAFKAAKKLHQWKKRLDTLRSMLDAETRTGGLAKAGLDFVPKLLTRALQAAVGVEMSVPLQAHPYFLYHKPMLDQLGQFTQEMRNKQTVDALRDAADRATARILKESRTFLDGHAVGGDRWQVQVMRIAIHNGLTRARLQGLGAGDPLTALAIRRGIEAEMIEILELEAALVAARDQVRAIRQDRSEMIERMKGRSIHGRFFGAIVASDDASRDDRRILAHAKEDDECDAALARVRDVAGAWAGLVDDSLLIETR